MAVIVSDTTPLNYLILIGAVDVLPSVSSQSLDAGEEEALALALETRADLLLIDERAGTVVARDLGLMVTGTLGVLDQAAKLGLIDLPTVFARLVAKLLAEDAARKA